MLCPKCGSIRNTVAQTRVKDDKNVVVRVRTCNQCASTFTTIEVTLELYERLSASNAAVNCIADSTAKIIKDSVPSAFSTEQVPRERVDTSSLFKADSRVKKLVVAD